MLDFVLLNDEAKLNISFVLVTTHFIYFLMLIYLEIERDEEC